MLTAVKPSASPLRREELAASMTTSWIDKSQFAGADGEEGELKIEAVETNSVDKERFRKEQEERKLKEIHEEEEAVLRDFEYVPLQLMY